MFKYLKTKSVKQ